MMLDRTGWGHLASASDRPPGTPGPCPCLLLHIDIAIKIETAVHVYIPTTHAHIHPSFLFDTCLLPSQMQMQTTNQWSWFTNRTTGLGSVMFLEGTHRKVGPLYWSFWSRLHENFPLHSAGVPGVCLQPGNGMTVFALAGS